MHADLEARLVAAEEKKAEAQTRIANGLAQLYSILEPLGPVIRDLVEEYVKEARKEGRNL